MATLAMLACCCISAESRARFLVAQRCRCDHRHLVAGERHAALAAAGDGAALWLRMKWSTWTTLLIVGHLNIASLLLSLSPASGEDELCLFSLSANALSTSSSISGAPSFATPAERMRLSPEASGSAQPLSSSVRYCCAARDRAPFLIRAVFPDAAVPRDRRRHIVGPNASGSRAGDCFALSNLRAGLLVLSGAGPASCASPRSRRDFRSRQPRCCIMMLGFATQVRLAPDRRAVASIAAQDDLVCPC